MNNRLYSQIYSGAQMTFEEAQQYRPGQEIGDVDVTKEWELWKSCHEIEEAVQDDKEFKAMLIKFKMHESQQPSIQPSQVNYLELFKSFISSINPQTEEQIELILTIAIAYREEQLLSIAQFETIANQMTG